MRPLLTAVGIVLVMAGIYAYTEFAERTKPAAAVHPLPTAPGEYAIRITCTADCVADPDFDLPALEVRLAEQVIWTQSETQTSFEPRQVDRLSGVVAGRNELFVQAYLGRAPRGEDFDAPASERSAALRIEVLRDGVPLAEATQWSEPGQPRVIASLVFDTRSAGKDSPP